MAAEVFVLPGRLGPRPFGSSQGIAGLRQLVLDPVDVPLEPAQEALIRARPLVDDRLLPGQLLRLEWDGPLEVELEGDSRRGQESDPAQGDLEEVADDLLQEGVFQISTLSSRR